MDAIRLPGTLCVSIIGAVLAFGGMAPSSAELVVKLPETTGAIDLEALNDQTFKSGFWIGLAADPETLGLDELGRAIDALPVTAPNGLPLRNRDFTAAYKIGIGVTDPTVVPRISAASAQDGKTELVVGFRDRAGNYVQPEPETIGVFDERGRMLPHQASDVPDSGLGVHVSLLLDTSGSMSGVIDQVRDTASLFLSRLPRQAKCRVTSFNSAFTRHTPGFEPCDPVLHRIGDIGAGGGTDIYTPLRAAYREGPDEGDGLHLVVIVTDGVGQSRTTREEVLDAKKASSTFVYWLGRYDETRLDGIADTFIHGRDDMEAVLARFFAAINDALDNQVVITIGGKEAKP